MWGGGGGGIHGHFYNSQLHINLADVGNVLEGSWTYAAFPHTACIRHLLALALGVNRGGRPASPCIIGSYKALQNKIRQREIVIESIAKIGYFPIVYANHNDSNVYVHKYDTRPVVE